MLSITQLKKNIYPVFYLLRRTGSTIEVVYKGVVYDLIVKKTDKKPHLTRAKRSFQKVQKLETTSCESCGSLVVNGICMNRKCTYTNSL